MAKAYRCVYFIFYFFKAKKFACNKQRVLLRGCSVKVYDYDVIDSFKCQNVRQIQYMH